MAINVLPPTITSGGSGSALKQYQQEFTQESGWVARPGVPAVSQRTIVRSGPAGTFASVYGTTTSTIDVTFDGGLTWTAQNLPVNTGWTGLVYGGGAFVAVGGTSTSSSINGGLTWNAGGSLPIAANWIVAYDGTSFLAINPNNTSVATATLAVATSNATAWTTATAVPGTVTHLAGGNGIWVALNSGSSTYYTSTNNGSSWVTQTRPGTGTILQDVFRFANGRFMFVAGNTAFMSTDGLNWTTGSIGTSQSWTGLAYGVDRWMLTGNAGTGTLGLNAYSLDNGSTWLTIVFPVSSTAATQGVAYSSIGGFLTLGSGSNAYTIWPFPGLWTCPAGVLSIDCLLIGAGGGGGGGVSTSNGGGGGGGQYIRKFLTVVPGTTYSVSIGTGGYGQSGNNGRNGFTSTFGSLLTAIGGGGGGYAGTTGSTGASGGGGSGSNASGCGGGGGGGAGGPGGNAVYVGTALTSTATQGGLGTAGSGGGFGAAVASMSGSGGPGINGFCGGGGAGGGSTTFLGGIGSAGGGRGGLGVPGTAANSGSGGGGGGGGAGGTNTGGNGGSGYCQITWWA